MSTETSCHFGHLLLVSNHRRQQFLKNPFFFTFFPYKSIRDQIWPCCKIGQGQPKVIIWANLVVLEHPIIPSFKVISLWFQRKRFLRFLPIWAWRPYWSNDQDHLSKLSFSRPIEAPYEIWLWLAQWFLRRRCLISVDDDVRRRPTYPQSSPNELSAQVSWKIWVSYFSI